MPSRTKKSEYKTSNNNGSIPELMKELWQAAVNLRGSIEPADYKRYVLPVIFLRFLSQRYDALQLLEDTYPEKLRGLLPRIYAGSNLDRENVAGLINLFSKQIFEE